MTPSADSSGNPSNGSGGGAAADGNPSNGSARNSGLAQALKHDPGLAMEWSVEEQAILDEGLTKYASEPIVVRYATIAKQLQDKTVRDVALRFRWMTKKESGKRRKDDLTRKNKDKIDRVTYPSAKQPAHLAAQPSVPIDALPMLEVDTDDDISYKAMDRFLSTTHRFSTKFLQILLTIRFRRTSVYYAKHGIIFSKS